MQEELSSLFEALYCEERDDRRSEPKGKSSVIPLLLTDPRKLVDLLQICTLIAKGCGSYMVFVNVYCMT